MERILRKAHKYILMEREIFLQKKIQGYSKVMALQFLADLFNGHNDISWLCCVLSLIKNPITLIKITPSGFYTAQ